MARTKRYAIASGDISCCFVLRTPERSLTDRTRARDYFAEYQAAIEVYGRAIENAFSFAFVPEHDRRGKEQRRALRSDRLTMPWSRQKESATTGIRPEHGLDNENPAIALRHLVHRSICKEARKAGLCDLA
jgi:hypothetical protein